MRSLPAYDVVSYTVMAVLDPIRRRMSDPCREFLTTDQDKHILLFHHRPVSDDVRSAELFHGIADA